MNWEKHLKDFLLFILLVAAAYSCATEEDAESLEDDTDITNCDVVPILERMKTWADNYPSYLEDTITQGALAVYKDQLYLVDNNIFTPDIYVFNFDDGRWEIAKDSSVFFGLENTYEREEVLPWGLKGIEIAGDTLFAIGIERGTFSAIGLDNQEFIPTDHINLPFRPCACSQGPSGIAYDHPYLYFAYHRFDYSSNLEETQRIYGVNMNNNALIFNAPLHLSDKRGDGAHGLTTFNDAVWHVRDENLVKMDGKTGHIINIYNLNHAKRSSSICYFKNSLWISTYYGGLIEVPLRCI